MISAGDFHGSAHPAVVRTKLGLSNASHAIHDEDFAAQRVQFTGCVEIGFDLFHFLVPSNEISDRRYALKADSSGN